MSWADELSDGAPPFSSRSGPAPASHAPSASDRGRRRDSVYGCLIDVASEDEALERIDTWAAGRESRAVFFCNAHSVVTARRSAGFAAVVERSDLALPDGQPVAWTLRRSGHASQRRVCGPDLMLRCCEQAAERGHAVYLFGSDPQTLVRLASELRLRFPALSIAGVESPPFRPMTPEEDAAVVERIRGSGARLVFVGLGCPKQEVWIDQHRGRLPAVMVGVGAAFGFHAGTVRRAPAWMQRFGLEWLFRLLCEPRKLWRRYLLTNTLYVAFAVRGEWRRRTLLVSED